MDKSKLEPLFAIIGIITLIAVTSTVIGYNLSTEKETIILQDSSSVNETELSESVVEVHSETSYGSGFSYKDKYIVTNRHVVGDTENVQVHYYQDEWSKGTVIGSDKDTDIAVIRVKNKPDYVSSVQLADNLPPIGAEVYAVGSPRGYSWTVTKGTVTGLERSMITKGQFSIPDLIQTDAALNSGNSGGPLYVSNDTVVGVNRAKKGENIGFTISSRLTEKVAQEIINNGNINHPYIGIATSEVTPKYNQTSVNDGLYVQRVIEDSPAFDTIQKGDVLLRVGDKELSDTEDLSSYLLLNKSPGDTVSFKLFRNNSNQSVNLQLTKRP